MDPSLSRIPLGPDVWFDPAAYALMKNEQTIPLDRREAELLQVLLRMPRCPVNIETIAKHIMLPADFEKSLTHSHNVHETVRCLRQKLGDFEHRIIRNFRGVGYGIFPNI